MSERTIADSPEAGPEMGDTTSRVAEDEISLRDIFDALRRQKRIVFGCMGLTVFVGLLYAVFTTPLYTATVTVQPAIEEDGTFSNLSGQLGGVAALAGINLGAGGSNREEYLATLRSRSLAENFITRNELMPHLFPERWDAGAGKWKGDGPGLIGRMTKGASRILAILSGDEGSREAYQAEPTMWEAYKKFDEEIRRVSEDAQTGIVTIAFEFRNPERAEEWANAFVAMANQEIRERTVEEASRALEYLNGEAESATMAGVREAIYSVIESQLNKITLANARPEYAFRIIDQAVVPEEHSHPKRALIAILSLILGGMLGVLAALVRESWRGRVSSLPEHQATHRQDG